MIWDGRIAGVLWSMNEAGEEDIFNSFEINLLYIVSKYFYSGMIFAKYLQINE